MVKDDKNNRTAVMYGAGNIGRGFIGQVFYDSGFEVVFIDVNKSVVSALNEFNSYTQLIIDGDTIERKSITGVRAVDGRDEKAVAKEISGCEIMAVSVGAAALPHIAPLIASGIILRDKPLNILVCENLVHAPDVLRGYISEFISDSSALDTTGFVGTTIGRMVPVMSEKQQEDDPTLIAVESFCHLPIDRDAIVPPMPDLKHTIQCSPFAFEEGKKLYIHNMGHSSAAYLGYQKGYTFIWQAMDDAFIREVVKDAMNSTAEALARKYKEDRTALTSYVSDLLSRFSNKGLGDTVARVGADPMRKLAPGDRFMGAVDLCREQGIDYGSIISGVKAALKFNVSGDPSAGVLQAGLKKQGAAAFLVEYCGLSETDTTSI